MPGLIHALDFLESPPAGDVPRVCILFGSERFLKSLVRRRFVERLTGGNEDAEASITVYDGPNAKLRDIVDELSTMAMFGGGKPRLAIVEDGEKFVEANRAGLEAYVEKPRGTGVLLLDVDTCASNTRLHKAVLASKGLIVDCRVPEAAASPRSKEKPPDEARVAKWLVKWAQRQHKIQLPADATEHLLQQVGIEFGLLDSELAKLALFLPENGVVTTKLIDDVVGGWRAKSVWDLNDAIAGGDAAQALEQLDRLIQAGQEPQALIATISWSLRRFAALARYTREAERRGRDPKDPYLLQQAGFWVDAVPKAVDQWRQIGPQRGRRLYRWLMEADLALKGSHSHPADARFMLENLIFRLSRHVMARRATARPSKAAPRSGR